MILITSSFKSPARAHSDEKPCIKTWSQTTIDPMAILSFVGLTMVCFIPGMEKRYIFQIMIAVIFASLSYAIKIIRQSNTLAGALFVIASTSCAIVAFSPHTVFPGFSDIDNMKFGHSALSTLVYILAVLLPVTETDENDLDRWLIAFGWLGLLSSTMMIIKFIIGEPTSTILGNPAMDATFVACLYPMMVLRSTGGPRLSDLDDLRKYPVTMLLTAMFVFIPPLAIFLSGSSTAMAVFFGILALYRFMRLGISIQTFFEGMLILIIGITASKILLGHELLNPNGRQFFWKTAVAYWLDLNKFVFGTGAGTYENYAPMVEKANGSDRYAFWAHNEYLQVCFEYGIAGIVILVAFLASWIRAGYRAAPWILVTIAGIAAAAVTQMPLRVYPWSLFCAVIVRLSFKLAKEEHGKSTIARSLEA